jgi:DNA primase
LEEVLDRAVPLADYYFSWLAERHGNTIEGKSQIANEISRLLAKVTNPFEADLLVRRAVDMLGIHEELLRRRPTAAPGARVAPATNPAVVAAQRDNRDDFAERSLLGLMLRLPAVLSRVAEDVEARQWFSAKWRPLVDGIVAEWQKRRNVELSQWLHQLSPELAQEISALVLDSERLSDAECDKVAQDCVLYLRRKHLKGMERNLRLAIRAAEEQKDENAKRERILEWQDLLQKERQLERPRLEPKMTVR